MERKRGQSSSEYLLIMGSVMVGVAIIAVLAYVIVTGPREVTFPVQEDKSACVTGNNSEIMVTDPITGGPMNVSLVMMGYHNVQLLQYDEPYDGTPAKSPGALEWNNKTYRKDPPVGGFSGYIVCYLQEKYPLYLDKSNKAFYLRHEEGIGGYVKYTVPP